MLRAVPHGRTAPFRMETLSGQVGRKTIRWIAALGYLFLGVVGAARLLG